jgi:phosphatidylglycerol:prolipoprotein diacylglycerol transferase
MLGFVSGLWTASRRGLRYGVAPQQVWDAGTWLIIGTIIGARTLYVISYWNEEFAGRPLASVFKVYEGGLVFYGGFIGCVIATLIFTRWQKVPLWCFADVLAPSISLGYVFGRIGCLMNGCCYGRACEMPWAVHYSSDHHTHGVGVHPTQVYDSVLNLGFYLALEWLFRRKKFDGKIFAVWLMGYAVLRSLVESFRGDYPVRYLGGIFTPAQLISLGVFTAGALLYLFRRPTIPQTA